MMRMLSFQAIIVRAWFHAIRIARRRSARAPVDLLDVNVWGRPCMLMVCSTTFALHLPLCCVLITCYGAAMRGLPCVLLACLALCACIRHRHYRFRTESTVLYTSSSSKSNAPGMRPIAYRSIALAMSISFNETPSQSCVVSVTSTQLYTLDHSG